MRSMDAADSTGKNSTNEADILHEKFQCQLNDIEAMIKIHERTNGHSVNARVRHHKKQQGEVILRERARTHRYLLDVVFVPAVKTACRGELNSSTSGKKSSGVRLRPRRAQDQISIHGVRGCLCRQSRHAVRIGPWQTLCATILWPASA